MRLIRTIHRYLTFRLLPRPQREAQLCIRYVDRLVERKLARAMAGGFQ